MSSILQPNAIELMYFLLDKHDLKIKTIVDMTLGNGNDAYKLLSKYTDAYLYGFDIQEKAIDNSRCHLLEQFSNSRFNLICDNHVNIKQHIDGKADLIIYNLGYLPGGDKNIKTNSDSTIKSLDIVLKEVLNKNGLVFITVYTGHPGGEREYDELIKYINGLNQKKFNAINFNYINQKNHPPILIAIERLI